MLEDTNSLDGAQLTFSVYEKEPTKAPFTDFKVSEPSDIFKILCAKQRHDMLFITSENDISGIIYSLFRDR